MIKTIQIDSISQSELTISQLTKDLEKEKQVSSEKSSKIHTLEQKISEIKQKYMQEILILQGELAKLKDEENYKNTFATKTEEFTTNSQRRLKNAIKLVSSNRTSINFQPEAQNAQRHKKGVSITNISNLGKINLQEPMTSKLVKNKKGDIQRNLLKGYLASKEEMSNSGIMESSTRTPGKTNPELSPYVMDIYQKSSAPYNENFGNKIRSSSNRIKYSKGIKLHQQESPKKHKKSMLSSHKKSKSQTSIHGTKSMDHRNFGSILATSELSKEPERGENF